MDVCSVEESGSKINSRAAIESHHSITSIRRSPLSLKEAGGAPSRVLRTAMNSLVLAGQLPVMGVKVPVFSSAV
jgi:hypothetical protein